MSIELPGVSLDRLDHGQQPLIRVVGEIDLTTAARVGKHIVDLAGTDPDLILDLTEVTFLGACALQMLDELHDELARAGRHLAVLAPPDRVAGMVLRLASMHQRLDIRETLRSPEESPSARPHPFFLRCP